MLQPATMRKVIKELTQLRSDPPEGIRVQVDEEDMLQFVGIIAGPEGTPYHGGYFKVRFTFGDEFPAAPPKCMFATKIFHPNVSAAGDICVSTLKKDWKPTYGITHILTVIKCLLIYPNPESALDEEAGKMLLDDYAGYCNRAKLMTSIHATRGGRPAEFEDGASAKPAAEDPLQISFLDSFGADPFSAPGPSTSSNAKAPEASSSTSSRPMHRGTSPKAREVREARDASQSPSVATASLPTAPGLGGAAAAPSGTYGVPEIVGLTIPPLRSSAQSNGAPRLSPAPNEKEPAPTSAAGAASGKSKDKETAKAGGKAVKRPASAVSGGVKEKGNGADKRKKGLKRL